jgi:pyridoxine/pyridoxamine 5'-phosphate oxidase
MRLMNQNGLLKFCPTLWVGNIVVLRDGIEFISSKESTFQDRLAYSTGGKTLQLAAQMQ